MDVTESEMTSQPEDPSNEFADFEQSARIIAQAASDAIITINQDSKILFVNQAAEKIFGYTKSEMLGEELTMLMPEYLRRLHRAGLKNYLETGGRHINWAAVELPGRHKNGTEILLELSFGEFSKHGNRYFTGVARDITKRKRDEERLALQYDVTRIMAGARSLAEASPLMLEAICVNLRCEVAELWLVDKDRNELHFEASWHLPSANVTEFLETSRNLTFPKGSGVPGRIWATKAPLWLNEIELNKVSLRTEVAKEQKLLNVFGFPILVGQDILGVIDLFSRQIQQPSEALWETISAIGSQFGQYIQRKRAEEERLALLAREQEARREAEAMTRHLATVQKVTDAALVHLSIDELLSELLGRIREVLNVDTVTILLLEKERGELVAWAARGLEEEVERGFRIPVGKGFAGEIVATGKPIIIENTQDADLHNPLLREKGIQSLLGVPLWAQGQISGVLHVGTLKLSRFTADDVRLLELFADRIALPIENARLFELERKARAEAERVNRVKDEFLAILSHELRTPLTPIMGWLHMIQSGIVSENDFAKGLASVTKNSYRLKRLISDLLDMSAVVSGKMRIEQNPVQLRDLLTEAIETLRPYALESNIQLDTPLLPETACWVVKGDRERLLQVFSNLLHNAIKFSAPGSRIRVFCETQEANGVIVISDEGEGIEPEFLPHVFERFRQADGSRTRLHGGLGVGLALVKSFVEAHGGTVEAASAGARKGSKFTVRLPLQPAFKSLSYAPARLETAAGTPAWRVMIVEDQPDTLEMLAQTFRGGGFEVLPCMSALEALELSKRTGFDLLISDVAMPVMDGLSLVRELRQRFDSNTLPAIALTGYASEADAKSALAAGFSLHLAKPVDLLELTRTAESLLSQRQTPKKAKQKGES